MSPVTNVLRLDPRERISARERLGCDSAVPAPAVSGADLMAALTLLDDHGIELLSMARLITGDVAVARRIVSEVLLHGAGGLDEVPLRDGGTRSVLATMVFDACRSTIGDLDTTSAEANRPMQWLAGVCTQQRCALALYLYSALTPHQIGTLLGLRPHLVCLLPLAALDELLEPLRAELHRPPLMR